MKILTVAIPCYNSEEYMEKCIKSILPVGDAVEILIVDDGSTKDRTAQIADRYAARYPGIIRAIHQENGGHGEAVNTGLRNASGVYYKVVDSDDWVSTKGLAAIVTRMQELETEGGVDMLLANFVYDKVGARHKRLMRFPRVFPQDQIFEWKDMHTMNQTQYILMHNIFYRTQMLRDCGMELPKHTFYVDNIFAFQPLPYVKRLYYMDINLYHYYIGREDQSVNEKVMMGRIDQQIFVNKVMIDVMAAEDFSNKSPRLKKYMLNYLSKVTTATSSMLILLDREAAKQAESAETTENPPASINKAGGKAHDVQNTEGELTALEKKDDIWNYLKEKDPGVYRSLRYNIFGIFMNLPGKTGRKISYGAYKAAQKVVGFN